LARLALDDPIESERAPEAIAALLIVQWHQVDLTRQHGGCVDRGAHGFPQARLEYLLESRQVGRLPAIETGPLELSNQAERIIPALRVRGGQLYAWHKSLLHDAVPESIRRGEPKLRVKVAGYVLPRIKARSPLGKSQDCTGAR